MGKGRKSRSVLKRSLAICAAAVTSLGAFAQTAPRPEIIPRTLDLPRLTIATDRVAANAGTIDFENVEGRQVGAGVELRDQYLESHGLSFGRGASVHYCARIYDDVNASYCPYPMAASGRRAAAHDVRSGGPAMVMNFTRPVDSIAMRINPTGGTLDEVFTAEVTGYDEAGNEVVQSATRFNWHQDAFTWPTSTGFKTDGGQIARVTVSLRRLAQNNQPVRFLIDDLSLSFAAEGEATPVADAIAQGEESDGAGRVVDVPYPVDTPAQRGDFAPPPRQVRLPIDWAAAEALVTQQDALGLTASAIDANDQADFDRAILPVILPGAADGDVDLVVQEGGDSYSAVYDKDGYEYGVYGTRLYTVLDDAPHGGLDAPIVYDGSDYSVSAIFSLFDGASYELTRYCEPDDEACFDHDALGPEIAELMVALGDGAEARP